MWVMKCKYFHLSCFRTLYLSHKFWSELCAGYFGMFYLWNHQRNKLSFTLHVYFIFYPLKSIGEPFKFILRKHFRNIWVSKLTFVFFCSQKLSKCSFIFSKTTALCLTNHKQGNIAQMISPFSFISRLSSSGCATYGSVRITADRGNVYVDNFMAWLHLCCVLFKSDSAN